MIYRVFSVSIFLLCFPSFFVAAKKPKCKLSHKGTLREYPDPICELIGDLIDARISSAPENEELPAEEEAKRLLILHGEPGTGKSTLAKIIKDESKSELISMSGASLVSAMQGSGASTIKEKFEEAVKKLEEDKEKTIVMLIEEVDSIANATPQQSNSLEYGNAYRELNQQLDKNLSNPRLLVICTTNELGRCAPAFSQRAMVVKIETPTPAEKKVLLKKLIHETSKHKIDRSYQSARHYVSDPLKLQLIEKIYSQMQGSLENQQINALEFQRDLAELKHLHVTPTNSSSQKQATDFHDFVQKFIAGASCYSNTQQLLFNSALLDELLQATDKQSLRFLQDLAFGIKSQASHGEVTKTSIQEVIAQAKKSAAECKNPDVNGKPAPTWRDMADDCNRALVPVSTGLLLAKEFGYIGVKEAVKGVATQMSNIANSDQAAELAKQMGVGAGAVAAQMLPDVANKVVEVVAENGAGVMGAATKAVAFTAGVGNATLSAVGITTTSTVAPIVVGVVVIGGTTYVVYKVGDWCIKKLF